MTLKNLLTFFGKIDWQQVSPDFVVQGVTSDSRQVSTGFVFVAVKGVNSDGHDYLQKAMDQGACAVVVESTKNIPSSYKGAIVQVLDSPMAYASMLAEYYNHPEDKLISIGITGTNGKTSSSYLIEQILNLAHVPCGVMGTIDHHLQKKVWESALTTPDTATFYQRLQDFVSLGAKAYVMEVSSHSLKQKRVPTRFDVALFTNFTRDHLDYHATMEDYFASKQKLFTEHLKQEGDVFVVLNADDAKVKGVRVDRRAQTWTFGQTTDCDFIYKITQNSVDGMTFELIESKAKQTYTYQTSMIGAHNVANCVGAIAVARCLGISHIICKKAIQQFTGVPGRLQRVPNKHRRHVFIDYAHTPDALEKVLQAALKIKAPQAQLITIFGCGGDRDQGKRPLMMQMAQKYSSLTVVTSDNPRSENPQAIIQQILAGSSSPAQKPPPQILAEVDREEAFKKALAQSHAEDVIVVAGKGHEDYQIIGTTTLPFSDFEKMKTLLERDAL
jgi:UDP-N-acetylmuramoyl-L-alanyl-D-glutamate--2,6-diaminopimelate ligase